ncbi:MAG: alkaline phytoceramidase [Gammaproteobacteria bacterium]|nr:alkaline phytoceramidase [Gammaproteobacteria bacterium]MBU1733163.1 alkaline phytoceramidase [Gammaproteobacteria bacterium]MBU1892211.1 alkaline phytoceramidase [Gammaproteobacteria bacterium]
MSKHGRIVLLAALTAGIVVTVFVFVPPFAQPQWYHDFTDRRAWLGVPNFLDVTSNALFFVIGTAGLARLSAGVFAEPLERWPYAVFFAGLVLTGVASGWYHLEPADTRLAGDRLAMSVTFAGFTAAVLTERLGLRCGLVALSALLVAGPSAVLWWAATEAAGAGDLRPYGLVQFTPMLLVPLLLWLIPARYTRSGDLLAVLGLYALALALEWLDRPIFELTGSVSGHTLKHLVAALAGYCLLRHVQLRRLKAREDKAA